MLILRYISISVNRFAHTLLIFARLNVVWTVDKTQNAKKAGDLPPETEIYNLFDGIVSFTKSHIRDEWIERNFHFQS